MLNYHPPIIPYSEGIGSFSDSGVTTESVKASGNDSIINCSSTHLTSFAVLVNVAGTDVSQHTITL